MGQSTRSHVISVTAFRPPAICFETIRRGAHGCPLRRKPHLHDFRRISRLAHHTFQA